MARRVFKTILVGIEIPHQRRQPALRRCAQLAKRTGARIVLFHSAFSPYAVGPNFYRSTLEQGVKKTLTERRAALRRLAEPLRKRGLKVTVKAAWDYPAHEGLVREVLRSRPDLVVAESRRRSLGARLFLSNTDWELIRLCPVPLLFVKKKTAWRKAARVLAAVDPMHANAKPARLDQRILALGHDLAQAHRGRLDVAHAYVPPSHYATSAYDDPIAMHVDPQMDRQYEKRLKQALQRTVRSHDLPASQVHLQIGSAHRVLPALARRLRTDVVVMGAVSRRGLSRLFIGNTAERVIDDLDCDVLVVKPARFKTPVARRSTPTQLALPAI